jgi:aminoglycoside phosphotransferase (APT) family kinase protein
VRNRTIIGTPFYVMDFVNGRIVEDHALAGY